MTRPLWSLDELVESTRSEEPEVRFWAIDRLVRHYPTECADAIQGFLLDDHDATPALVARHLGEHGARRHHSILLRGFKLLRGLIPGHCLQALARLGYEQTTDLALDALERGDLTEPALALIVEALAESNRPEAEAVVREYLERKPELLIEPAALRGVLRVVGAEEIPDVLGRLLHAMQWKGSHRAGEAFRIVMDELRIDDAAWCFRTGPSGHIELRKTIKAVESGYDCEISNTMGEATVHRIAHRFRAGSVADTVRALADWTAPQAAEMKVEPDSDLPARIAEAVGALSAPDVLRDAERLGHQFLQWLLGFQLSAAFAVARAQTRVWTMKEARGKLDALLELAELETAFHLSELPGAIALACADDRERHDRAQEWCLRMLEAQGPFFPKVVALETLGELQAVHFIPEVMDYLTEENSYVYGAAERALSRMGPAVIPAAVQRIESGQLDPDAAHSLLVLLCDLGVPAAHDAVLRHLDWFMDTVGPGTAAEWVSLFGTEELIDPLRDWLDQDPPLVGQSLLLLGAIHNVRIPEEEDILRAIEDEQARQDGEDGEAGPDPGEDGSYLM